MDGEQPPQPEQVEQPPAEEAADAAARPGEEMPAAPAEGAPDEQPAEAPEQPAEGAPVEEAPAADGMEMPQAMPDDSQQLGELTPEQQQQMMMQQQQQEGMQPGEQPMMSLEEQQQQQAMYEQQMMAQAQQDGLTYEQQQNMMMQMQQMQIDPNNMTEEQFQMLQQQQQMMAGGMQIDLSQMTPEEQQNYLYQQQQYQMQQQMMAGQYDPNQQFIGPEGQIITPEQYQQMLQAQGGMEYDPNGDYGQEIMQDPNRYMDQRPPEDPIQDKIQQIIEICATNNAFYGDPEFPAENVSLYNDPENLPEYAIDNPPVEWKRPHEICPEGTEPKMAKDGANPGDIRQGILGDCWFLGSLLVQSTNAELLNNLIYHDGIKYGFAVFQFFKNGRWQHIMVDTRIPYNPQTKTPLYGRCDQLDEFWVPLMEKAYAKLHGTYEKLHGGSISESMVDLTGGVSEKFYLRAPEIVESIEGGQFWRDLKKYHQQGFLLGCANTVKDENGNQEDMIGPNGILSNHAYGIMKIVEVGELQMIRIRNPWGQGEWTGKFCDDDEAWDDNKGLKDRLDYKFMNDGNWWMEYKDFCAYFNKVYLCKIFPSTWSQYSINGEWAGNSAGGPYPVEAKPDEESKETVVKVDTNDKWFNNPQFRISVTKKTNLIISLMQEDEKISKRGYIPVNFLVVRVKSKRDRLWEINQNDIILEAADNAQRFGQREITQNCTLLPEHDKKPVHYMIVPNTDNTQVKKDMERPFFLRIFSSDPIDLVQLPNTIQLEFKGQWKTMPNSAGGRLIENGKENQFWCRNPQYFLNITRPTHLKIILKKKGGKKIKNVPIGLVVTKGFSPTTQPPTQIISGKAQGGQSKKLSSFPTNGMTYAENLRAQAHQERAEKIPDFEPPQLHQGILQRKLQIQMSHGEWYEESFYCNDDVAALYAFYQPTQGPFIIVPSMSAKDIPSDFVLTIFSSQFVEVKMLEEAKNVVLQGEWTDKSCGGCHLYDKAFEQNAAKFTWATNPKFVLKLDSPQGQCRVKITLSRPAKVWKKQVGMNMVGCMIGFYVYPQTAGEPTKEAIINQEGTKFVPWNETSEELILDGHPEGYIIMACTYEPGKQGPFMLSVSAEVEFSLTQLLE